MIIEIFPSGPLETNAILFACAETKEAAVIDVPFQSADLIASTIARYGLKLKMILLTHSHWDHIAEVFLLKNKFNAPVWIHKEDEENLKKPGTDGLPCFIPIVGVVPDNYLYDGQTLYVGKLPVQVIHTPGHSPGGCCFYVQESQKRILFSGDTLFQGSFGSLSFATARPALMWESLKKLGQLPPETKVYPGHGGSTTIAAENYIINRGKELWTDY